MVARTVVFVVFALSASIAGAAPNRLLIVGQGPDGHPPATHEFMAGAKVLAELLRPREDVQITVPNADELLDRWAEANRIQHIGPV